ncbi:MAG TPA: hypothetical protein DEQ61_20465 [Streptomyces sp.]|nr:hypothetical protein [Streptomyces sp.]
MSRRRTVSRKKKIALAVGAAAAAGGIALATTATSQAGTGQTGAAGQSQARAGTGENCQGLEKALANNEGFIAAQQADPDANSAARIANREAVIDLIRQRLEAAGCTGGDAGAGDTGDAGNAGAGDDTGAGEDAGAGGAPPEEAAPPGEGQGQAEGEVVCEGSTVTVSGEGGAPAASSGEFPEGTLLKVTNLDNDKSTTVSVTATSGSCVLLNTTAFEEVREAGKFLIRNARIERVG